MLLLALASCHEEAEPTRPSGASTSPVAAPGGMCEEHGVPEALCTRCNPALAAVFRAKGDWCEEHGFPESFCPVCNPGTTFPDVDGGPPPEGASAIEARVVRLRSSDIEASAGFDTVPARRAQASPEVSCPARIAFDADRMADVRAIVPGVVRRLRVELGAYVAAGAPLFDLESARVGEIQGVLSTARERVSTASKDHARHRELYEAHIVSAREVELAAQELAAAEAEANAAEAALRMTGAARSAPSGRYTLTAPLGGTVVRRPAVVGTLATESTSLATLADTSVMWALCDVPEADAGSIALGQPGTVWMGGADSTPLHGEVTWIAAEVDSRTRTVSARLEVPNDGGRLRANQFARARIQIGAPQEAVTVPRAAVQRVGEHEVVFVRTAPGTYAPRVVRRHGDGDLVQVEGKLADGDPVVTTGAVFLRTEVMPGSIGAGCCEVDPPGGK